jgi:hypothetical protein
MNKLIVIVGLLLLSYAGTSQLVDARIYELRIYQTEPGRMDALVNRFANHTLRLFEKHGMRNEGYWLSAVDSNQLYYVLSYPSIAERELAWKAFSADPTWQKVRSDSEQSGKIVSGVVSTFLSKTDFSTFQWNRSDRKVRRQPKVFELRTYTCYPGRLPALQDRFRQHTTRLFERHGMQNVVYWTTIEEGGDQAQLVYLLAHDSIEAAKQSFDAFGKDPDWQQVREASEKDGKIVSKLESIFLTPLSFSAIR